VRRRKYTSKAYREYLVRLFTKHTGQKPTTVFADGPSISVWYLGVAMAESLHSTMNRSGFMRSFLAGLTGDEKKTGKDSAKIKAESDARLASYKAIKDAYNAEKLPYSRRIYYPNKALPSKESK
jgi:hypothetical protein